MKDDERLGVAGSDEDRRLLRAGRDAPVPPGVQDSVRRALDARIHAGRRPPWRLALGVVGALIAATAAASSLGLLDPLRDSRDDDEPAPAAQQQSPSPVRGPTIERVPSNEGPPPSAREKASQPGPGKSPSGAHPTERPVPTPAPAPGPPLIQKPGLDLPTLRRVAVEVPSPAPGPAPAPAPAPRLLIRRANRQDIVLSMHEAGGHSALAGAVRGRRVALTVEPKRITGLIGDDAVLVNVFGSRRAEGQVGGREIDFRFTPTARGWLVGASLPDTVARVELDPARLSFLPGCDRDLPAVAGRPGAYDGPCAGGDSVRIELPPEFLRLSHAAQMVVLGILLPEVPEVDRNKIPPLFPAP